jgi:hypothetical protein
VAAVGVDTVGGGDRLKQLLDAGGECADLAAPGVDLVGQHAGQLRVMVVEPAGQRLGQGAVGGLELAAGQAGQHRRVTLPGDQRLPHVPHRQPVQLAGHARHLDQRLHPAACSSR